MNYSLFSSNLLVIDFASFYSFSFCYSVVRFLEVPFSNLNFFDIRSSSCFSSLGSVSSYSCVYWVSLYFNGTSIYSCEFLLFLIISLVPCWYIVSHWLSSLLLSGESEVRVVGAQLEPSLIILGLLLPLSEVRVQLA